MSAREKMNKLPTSLPITPGTNPVVALQDEVNRLFNSFFGEVNFPNWLNNAREMVGVRPAVDVVDTGKEYSVTAELPGMDAKDVEVSLADRYLTIKGEKKQEKKEEKEGYFRTERSYGSFNRVVTLPENANFEKAEARFDKGVLTITMPKNSGINHRERTLAIKQAA